MDSDSSFEAKLREVHQWLEEQFGGKKFPSFEENPRTVEILHQIMTYNVSRTKDLKVLMERQTQSAADYDREGEKLQKQLICL